MSRDKRRQQKVWQERQAKQKFNSAFRAVSAEQARDSEQQQAGLLKFEEYTVTDEYIADTQIDRLTPEDRAEFESCEVVIGSIYRREDADPGKVKACITALERLYRTYPDISKLNNYLGALYDYSDEQDKVNQLTWEGYHNNPNNVFAVASYVRMLLLDGKVDEAGKVLEGKMSILEIIPDRRTFHVSELIAYQTTTGLYFAVIGKTNTAKVCLKMVEEFDPDHPHVRHLRQMLSPEYAPMIQMMNATRKLAAIRKKMAGE